MAKKKRTFKDCMFKPGQSGNPAGLKPHPPELKKAKKLTKAEVELSLSKFLFMTKAEVKARIGDPDCPMIDHIIGQVIEKAIKYGDHNRLEFLFNRLIGKVHEKVLHEMPRPVIIRRRNGEEIELAMKPRELPEGE